MVKRLEHIGIAVEDYDQAIQLFTTLFGRKPYKSEIVDSEGVKTIFFALDSVKIELLVSTREDSVVSKFIQSRGQGIHHLAFEVEDINTALQDAKENGFKPLSDSAKEGADNKRIAFLHPKSTGGVLIEFCQEKPALESRL